VAAMVAWTSSGSLIGTCIPSRIGTSVEPPYPAATPMRSAWKIASSLAASQTAARSTQKRASR
jgi:hypothetical protein